MFWSADVVLIVDSKSEKFIGYESLILRITRMALILIQNTDFNTNYISFILATCVIYSIYIADLADLRITQKACIKICI